MMKDFGGLVRRDDDSPGRSKKSVAVVIIVVVLAVIIAWLAQGRIEKTPPAPADERLEAASSKIHPSLDPEQNASLRYPGSPWERRNNMLEELINIVEKPGAPYDLAEAARNYVREIGPAIDSSCAELLILISRDPVEWSGVVAYAGSIREILVKRFERNVEAWPEEHRASLRGVIPLFVCH